MGQTVNRVFGLFRHGPSEGSVRVILASKATKLGQRLSSLHTSQCKDRPKPYFRKSIVKTWKQQVHSFIQLVPGFVPNSKTDTLDRISPQTRVFLRVTHDRIKD